MSPFNQSRRDHLKSLIAGALIAGAPRAAIAAAPGLRTVPPARHEQRIAWWREAKFGMFIHWGLYSLLCRDAWAMGDEDIPLHEYEKLADQFKPEKDAAAGWARLARKSGMKYMVMTAKHHEGFCLFNSALTGYCAPKHAAGRDLIQEYVDATRAEGLRVGLYYSLMDWHHPDWLRVRESETARKRFIEYIHGQVRELMTQYGKIDILWYDMPVPLDAAGWESEKLNRMVLELQPEIIFNNRSLVSGDFSTPEQNTQATKGDWESCMTMNDTWGYVTNDHNWKSPHQLLQNLVECARDGGNYLLNIGPRADGSVPGPSVHILGDIGRWLESNGAAVYGTQRCFFPHGDICAFTRKNNTLYIHVYFWPGETLAIGGVTTAIKSAKLMATNQPVTFTQKGRQLIITGLPATPLDDLLTVIEVECESEPIQQALSSIVDTI